MMSLSSLAPSRLAAHIVNEYRLRRRYEAVVWTLPRRQRRVESLKDVGISMAGAVAVGLTFAGVAQLAHFSVVWPSIFGSFLGAYLALLWSRRVFATRHPDLMALAAAARGPVVLVTTWTWRDALAASRRATMNTHAENEAFRSSIGRAPRAIRFGYRAALGLALTGCGSTIASSFLSGPFATTLTMVGVAAFWVGMLGVIAAVRASGWVPTIHEVTS